MELIAGNPRAAFNVALDLGIIEGEQACNWSCRYQSVVGHGRIRLLVDPEETRQGFDIIMKQYSGEQFAYPDKMIVVTTVYKLLIVEMSAKQSRIDPPPKS